MTSDSPARLAAPVLLSDADLLALVSPAETIAAVRATCHELSAGDLEVPPRVSFEGGALLVMPARHRRTGTSVVKVANVDRGGARVSGLVVWTGPDGETFPLVGAGAFTALRTAATSALATDLLAPAGAHRLVVFGAGPQAVAHVAALAAVRSLDAVVLVGRDTGRLADAAARVAGAHPGLDVSTNADVASSLSAADVVCCATTAVAPLFDVGALGPRAHVVAVGSHQRGVRELPRGLLASAELVAVDDVGACLVEAGEVIDAVESGALAAGRLVALPDLVARSEPAGPLGRTVFKSVGTAAYDWALARLVAQHLGLPVGGTELAAARP